MKKNKLYFGIGYLLVGFAILVYAMQRRDASYASILYGLAGGGIGPGINLIFNYFYWSRPDKAPIYEAKMHSEQIRFKDERLAMLRARSGQITYQIMFFLLLLLVILGFFLGWADELVFSLFGLWVFQFVCGIAVFRVLSRRL